MNDNVEEEVKEHFDKPVKAHTPIQTNVFVQVSVVDDFGNVEQIVKRAYVPAEERERFVEDFKRYFKSMAQQSYMRIVD